MIRGWLELPINIICFKNLVKPKKLLKQTTEFYEDFWYNFGNVFSKCGLKAECCLSIINDLVIDLATEGENGRPVHFYIGTSTF